MRSVLFLAAMTLASAAQAQTVIFDTFNEDEPAALFDCCNALPLMGGFKGPHIAIPFDAPIDGHVVEIDVAISMDSGNMPRYDLRLYGSTNGLPGKVKHHFQARNPPPSGQCCQYVAATIRAQSPGVPVQAGGHYWVEINAEQNDVGGWNLNSTGASGPYASKTEKTDWAMTSGPLPAVRVIVR